MQRELEILGLESPGAVKVGRVVGWSERHMLLVDFDGNELGPMEARQLSGAGIRGKLDGAQVLLVFENGDPTRPIVIGLVRSNVRSSRTVRRISAHEIQFDAYERVVIRCGRSSIELTRDGRVNMQGTDVTSRASRTNRIKGSSVAIN